MCVSGPTRTCVCSSRDELCVCVFVCVLVWACVCLLTSAVCVLATIAALTSYAQANLSSLAMHRQICLHLHTHTCMLIHVPVSFGRLQSANYDRYQHLLARCGSVGLAGVCVFLYL